MAASASDSSSSCGVGSGVFFVDPAAHPPTALVKAAAAETPTTSSSVNLQAELQVHGDTKGGELHVRGDAKGNELQVPAMQRAMIVIGMVVFGAAATMLSKAEYLVWSIDLHGDPDEFKRPWAGVAASLIGMSLIEAFASGGARLLQTCAGCRCHVGSRGVGRECGLSARDIEAGEDANASSGSDNEQLDAGDDRGVASNGNTPSTRAATDPTMIDRKSCQKLDSKTQVLMGILPGILNLIATPSAYVALLYIPAPVWQMLRGASLIFTAILSIVFLKAKLDCVKWLGASTCLTGVFLVGLANFRSSDREDHDVVETAMGTGLMILSQLFMAATGVAEEYLVKSHGMSPTRVVSLEGAWGLVLLIVFIYPVLYMLPGVDCGHADDFVNTLVLLKNNSRLMMMFAAFSLASLGQNLCGILVSAIWSSVERRMLDGARSFLLWTSGLMVHYLVSSTSPLGQAWTSWSRLELLGFVVIMIGQLLYGGVAKRVMEARAATQASSTCSSEVEVGQAT